MTTIIQPAHLSNEELLAEIKSLAARERHATAALVASLAELDERRLYLGEGYSSLFTYCTQVLHLSEHAAYNRIEAARAARRFPVILTHLADGRVHLSAIRLLAPHLTPENHVDVLREASHKSKREVEHIVVRLQPQPDVASWVRKLPPARTTPASVQPRTPESQQIAIAAGPAVVPSPPRSEVAPLAPERYKVQFTVSADTYEKLRRAQNLLRHRIPNGDPAIIFDRALTLLLTNLEKTKLAAATRPQAPRASAKTSRHIPAAVRREVWQRDGGQCAFLGKDGRCTERGFLEFHHVIAYALDGPTTAENLQLRCRAHNAYESEQCFGSMWVRESTDKDAWLAPARSGTTLSDRSWLAAPTCRPHLGLAPADPGSPTRTLARWGGVAWKSAPSALSSATRVGSRNPTRQSRCGCALPLRVSRESEVAANETRAAGGRGCP